MLVILDSPPPFGGVRVAAKETSRFLSLRLPIKNIENSQNIFFLILTLIFHRLSNKKIFFQIGGIKASLKNKNILLILICKLLSYRIYLRVFAGNNASMFNEIKKRFFIFRYIEKVFFETVSDVIFFKKHFSNIYQFKNYRFKSQKTSVTPIEKEFDLIQIGDLSKDKGFDKTLQIAKKGNFKLIAVGRLSEEIDKNTTRFKHIPEINNDQIESILSSASVMILPSFWKTEGYPGVIIESMLQGIPVIMSNNNALSELSVEHCVLSLKYDESNFIERIKELKKLSLNEIKEYRLKAEKEYSFEESQIYDFFI